MSINSGKAIINACEKLGYNVQGFDSFDESILNQKFHFIFLALHGTFGEDGQIQKLLDKLKINYSHSNAKTSEIAMDKKKTKNVFKKIGVPYPNDIPVSYTHLTLPTIYSV